MEYKNQQLIIDDTQIYFDDGIRRHDVMMQWERAIMKQSVDYICERGGDILEIGFGMGIAANFI